mmetsp:Transcript_12292/g.32967  ORF Transcript_12292/g.32967 Transcript_12292/m.32967 type:complete len:108 (-) Transcript_12292:12-335(-)
MCKPIFNSALLCCFNSCLASTFFAWCDVKESHVVPVAAARSQRRSFNATTTLHVKVLAWPSRMEKGGSAMPNYLHPPHLCSARSDCTALVRMHVRTYVSVQGVQVYM